MNRRTLGQLYITAGNFLTLLWCDDTLFNQAFFVDAPLIFKGMLVYKDKTLTKWDLCLKCDDAKMKQEFAEWNNLAALAI